jgi:hypothetical protein
MSMRNRLSGFEWIMKGSSPWQHVVPSLELREILLPVPSSLVRRRRRNPTIVPYIRPEYKEQVGMKRGDGNQKGECERTQGRYTWGNHGGMDKGDGTVAISPSKTLLSWVIWVNCTAVGEPTRSQQTTQKIGSQRTPMWYLTPQRATGIVKGQIISCTS